MHFVSNTLTRRDDKLSASKRCGPRRTPLPNTEQPRMRTPLNAKITTRVIGLATVTAVWIHQLILRTNARVIM